VGIEKINAALRVYKNSGARGVMIRIMRNITKSFQNSKPLPEIWTGYMSWLTYVNAGMFNRGNAFCFDYAIRNLPSDAPIVEIGSFCGLSTNMITYLKEKYGVKNRLITCDKWVFEGSDQVYMGDSKISHAEYRQFVKETFIRNIKMFSRNDLPYTIEMFSDDFFNSWRNSEKHTDVFGREIQLGGPISFCYIDGNHSYEYAKRDFENCDAHLEPGGFILFDDSSDGSDWEVCKVVKEVSKTGRFKLVTKNPNYFFVKK